MLLGALVDAGAPLPGVQAAVDTILPDAVRLTASTVLRGGLRATKLDVEVCGPVEQHRRWAEIQSVIGASELSEPVRQRALAAFGLLAEAEGQVHGVPPSDVHFHEVGAWDSIADVVGVAAALDLLGVGSVSASPVALGSGRVHSAHGDMPVPVPAVLELARGWRAESGGEGELATPTGLALVRALATRCEDIPAMEVAATGMGAGSKDFRDRANVVRVVLGFTDTARQPDPQAERLWVMEANVDDLDPRVWPDVLARLMEAGAADVWLTPILMKKGRPAHTLAVLCESSERDRLRELTFSLTSTFGIREHAVDRVALGREWRPVDVLGHTIRIKVSLGPDGRIRHATAELEDASAAARATGVPLRQVLEAAGVAAEAARLASGETL